MTDKAEPKRIGRPPLPADKKLVVVPIRLTPAQRDKLQQIGVQRLRDWDARAATSPAHSGNSASNTTPAPTRSCRRS